MTDPRIQKKYRRLSLETLGLFAVCFVVALLLYLFLSAAGLGVVTNYCADREIVLDEMQLYELDGVVFSVSLVVSVCFFIVLFLILFGERLAYIRTIIVGIDALRRGEYGHRLPAVGNNELTQLAEEVNYLLESEQELRAAEQRLQEEREALIRALSHDIRTPLTGILSYTQLLEGQESYTPEQQREYLSLVRRKAEQIKELTDVLLDGGNRALERFDNARVLMEQLAGEFEEMLEDSFSLSVDLSRYPAAPGCFDVRELRRIFDNLISNVQKYAEPTQPVVLSVAATESGAIIRQRNGIRQHGERSEGYRVGLASIRRIAQSYGGSVEILQDEKTFEIVITLSDI